MASHLYVLSKVELSFAYPFLSLAYVAVAVFAYFIFREDLNAWRIAGIAFICVGTVLIAQSGRGHDEDVAVGVATLQFIRARPFNETCDFRRRRFRRPSSCPETARRRPRGRRRRHQPQRPAALSHGDVSSAATSPIRHRSKRSASSADDMVYNLSAKMLSPIQVRAKRHDFFWPVNVHGTENIIAAMDKAGAQRLVHFTTDMIYGHTVTHPMTEDHPVAPLGEYGWSKQKTEELAAEWRRRGMHISLFRPRLIIGPGRLGILEKLFKLIDWNLPVPMIGSGKNPYQFISVFDCAEAARARLQGRRAERGLQSRLAQSAAGQEAARRPDQACRLEIAADPDAGLGGQAHARPARPLQHADHGSRAVSDRRRDVRARCRQGRAPARLGAAVPRRGHADRRLQGISPEEGRPRRRRLTTCRPNRSRDE